MAACTEAQLKTGAEGIAYRAVQLSGIAEMVASGVTVEGDSKAMLTVRNALVESALIHARGLARFFMSCSDVNESMYDSDWENQLRSLSKVTWKHISRYLGHSMPGDPEGDPHPGEWPVVELAFVLTRGLADFTGRLRSPAERKWFDPSPVATHRRLVSIGAARHRTRLSRNPQVAQLTIKVQGLLDGGPPP